MEEKCLVELEKLMSAVPLGSIRNSAYIEGVLASCWQHFVGHDGGMAGHKLIGRMEEVKWNPPFLSFVIERHGGIAMGSGYAELQSWTVNIEKVCATLVDDHRKRWLGGPRNSPLKVGPLAAEIAALIKTGKKDPRLKWLSSEEARIIISEIIPDDCPNQTLVGRRTRLKRALQESLREHGWELSTRTNTVKRLTQPSPDGPVNQEGTA